jgi:hypothetical protein
MKMPKQKPGQSRQDYGTPPEFIDAVVRLFGPLDWDLAANSAAAGPDANHKAPLWYGVEQDSLAQDWTSLRGNLWLNPPFKRIAPWAAKCLASAGPGRRILMLTPASVGSNWFVDHILHRMLVLALNPRMTFVGERDPYPKDLMLTVFDGSGVGEFDVWRWCP